jgi:hypothetical protein
LDLHVMNKQSIYRNKDNLLELIWNLDIC